MQTGAARTAALGHMAACYNRAFVAGDGKNPYPFTNAWTAELLHPGAASPVERESACATLLALQAEANARNPGFWGDVALAELKQKMGLLGPAPSSEPKAMEPSPSPHC